MGGGGGGGFYTERGERGGLTQGVVVAGGGRFTIDDHREELPVSIAGGELVSQRGRLTVGVGVREA